MAKTTRKIKWVDRIAIAFKRNKFTDKDKKLACGSWLTCYVGENRTRLTKIVDFSALTENDGIGGLEYFKKQSIYDKGMDFSRAVQTDDVADAVKAYFELKKLIDNLD
jgi:hypothetical protein